MKFRTRGPGPPRSGRLGPSHAPFCAASAACEGSSCEDARACGGAGGSSVPRRWTWTPYIYCLAFMLLAHIGCTAGEGNKKFSIASLCQDYFLQQQLRKIDGAELRSQNERNLNCIITFQTHSILQSFMLRFEELTLDCNDHLYIYDGAHAVGMAKWDLSCKDTREQVGPIHTRTNHVTLKYVTDNWGTENFGFNLIITAVKDPQTTCNDFRCKTREFCIHTDLVCDGVNHCADASDEMATEKCGHSDIGLVLGMSVTNLVVGCVSALLILGLAIVGVTVCCYRQGPGTTAPRPSTFQPGHHSGLNGSGTTSLSRGAPAPMSATSQVANAPHTLSLMQPGNWLCPVGTQLGYSADWARLYCCLVK